MGIIQGFNFWQFIAGIAVFVYAMNLIESSLKNLAGRSFKKFLQKQSQSKIKMVVASTASTAVLQSSSVVLLMVLSFVGAGLMNMRGALAAVLGSNLGTTLDSWIIATIGFKINLSMVSYPALGIALIGLLLFKKNTKAFYATTFLIGFAFIFIALDWLKGCVDKSIEDYIGSLSQFHYLYFIPIGFLITAVIQSSLVTVTITLAALYNHVLPFESAAAIVIGSELGTTLKFLVGSMGGIPDKKRVAWGNFILNLFTMLIATALLKPILYVIRDMMNIQDQMVGLVTFQTSINFLSLVLFYPMLGLMADLLERLFKEVLPDGLTRYIRKSGVTLSADALDLAEQETFYLVGKAVELNRKALGISEEQTGSLLKNIKKYASDSSSFPELYSRIKLLQGEILEYITEIPKSEMSETEIEHSVKLINIIRHVLHASKDIKDIRHNLEEFEASANDDLFLFYNNIRANSREFYKTYNGFLLNPTKNSPEIIDDLIAKNRRQYDNSIADMLKALRDGKVSDLDSVNLLNVNREIYSSNKALITILADLK